MIATLVPLLALAAAAGPSLAQDQYKGQYSDPTDLPAQVDAKGGQTGYNDCVARYGSSDAKADCVNLYANDLNDFCLYAPPSNATIGDDEAVVVSYCLQDGHGTRLIPEGTIQGAHFVKTPHFIQVTGVGDFTKINIAPKDEGGELDPHGATGSGNPIGGLVYTNALSGSYERMPEWAHFISADTYCLRACTGGENQDSRQYCQHVYDVMGCYWVMPASYDADIFEECDGDSGDKPGIYSVNGTLSTFWQGYKTTPAAHPAPSSSNCKSARTIGLASGSKSRPASSSSVSSASRSSKASKSSTLHSSKMHTSKVSHHSHHPHHHHHHHAQPTTTAFPDDSSSDGEYPPYYGGWGWGWPGWWW